MRGDLAHAQQHPGHEADAVEGVVAQHELLPHPAELDDLMGDQAALAHGVDVDAVHHRAAGAVGILLRRVRDRAEPRLGAAAGDRGRGVAGGAGVGFLVAMLLFCGVRQRVESSNPPESFKDLPITLVSAAITSMSFMGFGGLVENIINALV